MARERRRGLKRGASSSYPQSHSPSGPMLVIGDANGAPQAAVVRGAEGEALQRVPICAPMCAVQRLWWSRRARATSDCRHYAAEARIAANNRAAPFIAAKLPRLAQ